MEYVLESVPHQYVEIFLLFLKAGMHVNNLFNMSPTDGQLSCF